MKACEGVFGKLLAISDMLWMLESMEENCKARKQEIEREREIREKLLKTELDSLP